MISHYARNVSVLDQRNHLLRLRTIPDIVAKTDGGVDVRAVDVT